MFDQRIELDFATARPLRDAARNPGIKLGEIGLHRPGFECHRQCAPMQAVLVEIKQHQPARKKPAEDDIPAETRRENLLRIEQNEFVRLGTKHRDVAKAEGAAAVDQAVALRPPLDKAFWVGEKRQGVAEDRPTIVAGNVRTRCWR